MRNLFKLLLVTTAILFTGCGGKYANATSPTSTYGNSGLYQSTVIYSESANISPASAPRVVKRIITKRANIRVEVDSIEEANKALVTLIEKRGGHITNSNTHEDSYNASAKIPSANLVETLDAIASLGDKISQSISQNDVTNQFVDNEARLKNLILFRDKMKGLLGQTTNIEEIVKIERELKRVQTEIDSLQGRLKYLKDAVSLSPIDIHFKEKTLYGPLGYIGNGIWWVTKKLFVIK